MSRAAILWFLLHGSCYQHNNQGRKGVRGNRATSRDATELDGGAASLRDTSGTRSATPHVSCC